MTSAVEDEYQLRHEKYLAKKKQLRRKIAKARLARIKTKRFTDVVDRWQARYELICIPALAAWVLINITVSYLFEIPMKMETRIGIFVGMVMIIVFGIKHVKAGFRALRNKDKQ